MVLWECLTRKVPWGDATGVDVLMLAVLQGDRPPVPEDAPGDLRSLVESCWAQDPTDRPTLQKVCLVRRVAAGCVFVRRAKVEGARAGAGGEEG